VKLLHLAFTFSSYSTCWS